MTKLVYYVGKVTRILVSFAFIVLLTACSPDVKQLLPTRSDVEELFNDHFTSFDKVAQMIYDRPMFYEWYYQEYEWHDIREFLLGRIDDTKRREYFTDTEWQEITILFYDYKLSGIHMFGEGFPIEFYWMTSEQDPRNELIAVSYLYYPRDNAIPPVSVPFGSSTQTEHKNWTKVMIPIP